jgi:hypothetical protein
MQKDDFQLEAKGRQATKLAEIREALVVAGKNTTAKQAAVLGVCRSTAWVLLNRDKRAGPSAGVIKRILSSPKVPPAVRRKIEEYVKDKCAGLYGHSVSATRAFSSQFDMRHRDLELMKSNSSSATSLELMPPASSVWVCSGGAGRRSPQADCARHIEGTSLSQMKEVAN